MSKASLTVAPSKRSSSRKQPSDQVLRAGHGRVVLARKEIADHLMSGRFVVLLALLAIAALVAVNTAADLLRDVAELAVQTPGLFLNLFTIQLDPSPFAFVTFIGFLGPLLGIMFGFDSVIGEHSQGTLPRLLSQPIHRDEVITGKFLAGLTVIGLMIVSLTTIVTGLGILRTGATPTAADTIRLLVWLVITIGYVGLWLALSTMVSVATKRASTSALVTTGIWLVIALFGTYIFQGISRLLGGDEPLWTEIWVSRLSPLTLYTEATTVLLDPARRTPLPVGLLTVEQIDQAVLSNLSPIQSILVKKRKEK